MLASGGVSIVSSIDDLIEAISFSQDDETDWWEAFYSIQEAEETLRKAAKQNPDEYQIAFILTALDADNFFCSAPLNVFKQCIKKLKSELRKAKKNRNAISDSDQKI